MIDLGAPAGQAAGYYSTFSLPEWLRLQRAPEQAKRCEAVRASTLAWLRTGKRPSPPIGEALFPMVHTGVQELNEAISVHRCLSLMPSQISSSATKLLDILDLTLDGLAIRPSTDGARDIFHGWLGQAVPAALMERLPDHGWNGSRAWPPDRAGGQSAGGAVS